MKINLITTTKTLTLGGVFFGLTTADIEFSGGRNVVMDNGNPQVNRNIITHISEGDYITYQALRFDLLLPQFDLTYIKGGTETNHHVQVYVHPDPDITASLWTHLAATFNPAVTGDWGSGEQTMTVNLDLEVYIDSELELYMTFLACDEATCGTHGGGGFLNIFSVVFPSLYDDGLLQHFKPDPNYKLGKNLWTIAKVASQLSEGIYHDGNFKIGEIANGALLNKVVYDKNGDEQSDDAWQKQSINGMPAPFVVAHLSLDGPDNNGQAAMPYVMAIFRGQEIDTSWLNMANIRDDVKDLCRDIKQANYDFSLDTSSVGLEQSDSVCDMNRFLMKDFDNYGEFELIKSFLERCKAFHGDQPCQLFLGGHSNGGVYAHAAAVVLKPYLDEYYWGVKEDNTLPSREDFWPMVFQFGTPPPFADDDAGGCDYLNNDRVFNFINAQWGVYDIAPRIGVDTGGKHLGNQLIIGDSVAGVKLYGVDEQPVINGEPECALDLMKNRDENRLQNHEPGLYVKRIKWFEDHLEGFSHIREKGFFGSEQCLQHEECYYSNEYCDTHGASKNKCREYKTAGDNCNYGYECQPGQNLECSKLWNSSNERQNNKKCNAPLPKHRRCDTSIVSGGHCQTGLTCHQKPDGNNYCVAYNNNVQWLQKEDQCTSDSQCEHNRLCRRKKGQSNSKCWNNSDLRDIGDTCDNGENCKENLVCVKRYNKNNKKCFADTIEYLQDRGDRCNNDSQCAGSRTCYKNNGDGKKKCW